MGRRRVAGVEECGWLLKRRRRVANLDLRGFQTNPSKEVDEFFGANSATLYNEAELGGMC